MTTAKAKWIRNIHTAKTKLALDDDAYRLILHSTVGVESAGDISNWQQYDAVMTAFKTLGFKLTHTTKKKTAADMAPRNPAWITARQEYYIMGLWQLAARHKDERSLRAMVKRIGGVDDIRFLPKTRAQALILALRDIAAKAGYNPDTGYDNQEGTCC